MQKSISGKKVLLVGLGRLGGGVSTAKFLYKNDNILTITDLNTESELKKSVRQLKGFNIKFHLGGHKESDFKNNDIIVFNPAVSHFSPWVKLAQKYKKEFYNDYTLFLKLLQPKPNDIASRYIGITGTRGKTTVTTWIGYILSPSIIGGNIPQNGLLKIIDKITSKTPLVLELSSYQLEYVGDWNSFNNPDCQVLNDRSILDKNKGGGIRSPHVAVITNLSSDHLNRYGTIEKYLSVKANIFKNQTKNDFLILNFLDKYTLAFLKKKPQSQIYYFSLKSLPESKKGLFFSGEKVYFQENGKKLFISKFTDLSPHQKNNLLASMLASYLYLNQHKSAIREANDVWKKILLKTKNLPQILFRQQIILKKKNLVVVNDSASTSPEGTIVAIERFSKNPDFILVTGGTDKKLDFKRLSEYIGKYVKTKNLFLLNGSATRKLVERLRKNKYFKSEPPVFGSLKEIVKAVSGLRRGIIVFSPGSASFEKFKNEFDRGRKFNRLIKQYFRENKPPRLM
ncbi:UDP-N-acetylmuramoylalanine--D-glutamate ligase [Candidatus Wolfebacteria bacterium GWA1_42_9]|uniref:UDP-N-acetylmuramoylalanine--D-glutamate ligase n=1 Tax=Candidatus Wolfebacteria bacterium GWA1_42_9 TaxID=1802553 RepID=A0A1F8DNA3_9BACT|nr:MAG: UDP-N-acetylmuramoylalanine-D-glutamate ligase [Parcubacteria group bacterium GW2011_GWB1_43_8b]OGM90090.1 MAG: UDP-N-acetylmuramoylalanine--D-glutamate ligase [Candidatus Wolfebacteria bacterium GWA1_42_9]